MENNFSTKSGSYLRTTENINGYYNKFNFKDKSVLTVIGSSDQIFESILRGAKKVSGFDISENAILLYYLKEAAVKALSYEEYMDFFFVEYKTFSKEKYLKLRPYLNEKVLSYWDSVFTNEDINSIVSSMLVSEKLTLYPSMSYAESKLSTLSAHLKEVNFDKLKELINSVQIDISLRDVFEIDKVEGNYDYIILSNIFEYHDPDKYKALMEEYKEKLTDDGILIIGYAYHDVDLSYYNDYDIIPTESRWVNNVSDAPDDHLIVTGKKKLQR